MLGSFRNWFYEAYGIHLGHRAKLFTLLIFTIAIPAVVAWLILSPGLLGWLPPFVEFVAEHRSPIRILSALLALLCASFFFWPREGEWLVGRWHDFVGLAFATFFIQYLTRYLDMMDPDPASTIHIGTAVIVYICSGLNNLLFLAAARVLLNRSKGVSVPYSSKETLTRFTRFKQTLMVGVAEFRAALPSWSWIVAVLVAVLATFDSRPSFIWARFPDAIFSIYCLGWFGYAVAINFNVRRQFVLAGLALVVCSIYGAGQLVYASNPIVAYTTHADQVSSFPLKWVRQEIGEKVSQAVAESNSKANLNLDAAEFLDSAVFAILLPMKFVLFLPPFFLYLLFMISVNDFRSTLSETTARRKDYLSEDGIVSAIGESLSARRVCLYIRIPGVQRTRGIEEERVLPLTWRRGQKKSGKKLEHTSPVKMSPLLQDMMTNPKSQDFVVSRNGECKPTDSRKLTGRALVVLTVPIKFHGGAIGFLQTYLRGYGRFNHTTLQKLKLLAELVAPSVQDFRSLAAADQIGFRLTRLQFNHRDNLQTAILRVLAILHDVLSPLATGLFLEMGFVPFARARHANDPRGRLFEERVLKDNCKSGETVTLELEEESYILETCPMIIRAEASNGSGNATARKELGNLVLAIPSEKDDFARCTLAAYYLNRRTVASLATDGILDLSRDFYNSIIKELGVEFSKETLSRDEWFAAIENAVEKAGLLWVRAISCDSEEISTAQDTVELLVERPEPVCSLALSYNSGSQAVAAKTVRLKLTKSKHYLYVGVARPGFGPELSFQSPWKVFLRELADVADTALDTLYQRQKADIEKLESAQSQALMTIAVTTGTLMHQLVNMIKDQVWATGSLEEALAENNVKLDPGAARMLSAMKRSAGQMRDLTNAFKIVTRVEDGTHCSIQEAAEQALKFFQVALTQRKIDVEIKVPIHLRSSIPFHVAAFALANLIGNAKDAIKSHGTIGIEAEDDGESIVCHVTNSGPRIPADIEENLFKLGASTKLENNGWGLYLVSRSLRENGGAIVLDTSHPETRFTIRLPKPGPE